MRAVRHVTFVSLLLLLALATGLAGTGPTVIRAQQPGAAPTVEAPAPLVEAVRQDLAVRLGVGAHLVTVAETTAMTWNSLALGCPAPGRAYAEAITPGYRIRLAALGQSYAYHTDSTETFALCLSAGDRIDGSRVISGSGLLGALLARGIRNEAVDALTELPFMHGDGTRYALSGGDLPAGTEIQVYQYVDVAQAEADAALIDPDGREAQSAAALTEWAAPPIFFRSGSVIVIYVGDDARVSGLLVGLLGTPFTVLGASAGSASTDSATRASWEDAVILIRSGVVQDVYQAHSREVTLRLKDGTVVTTTEPAIDDVIRVIRECGALCATIPIATE